MKKSIIALAVLAASGAAMAQSSVTLYGIVDAYVGQTSTTAATPGASKVKQNVVNTAGFNNSRWGMKGSEDLGNGLKANFVLENGFNTDTGGLADAGGRLFNRQATVGLSGNFGAVNLGRQTTAYDALRAATNNQYDSNFATTTTVWNNGVRDYTNRSDNSIGYASPTISGFSGAVVLGLGENKAAATALTPTSLDATKNYSAHIKYANGPLLVGYAHQVENTRTAERAAVPTATPPITAAAGLNTTDRKYNLFAGSYDFGVAKLTGGYNQAKQGATEDKEFQVGVNVPFGAAAVSVGYVRSKSDINGANGNKGTGYSLLGTYDLSKRTRLYAGLLSTKVQATSAAADAYKTTGAGVGVRHAF